MNLLIRWTIAIYLHYCKFSAQADNSADNSCRVTNTSNSIDVFWINLEKSVDRKRHMVRQLKYYGLDHQHRVKAYSPHNIYIPEQLMQPFDCNTITDERLKDSLRMHPLRRNQKFVVQSLCGRRKNTMKDLAVTLSHLYAIRSAIYSSKQLHSKYALILEDDLQFSFGVDFMGLIESAPKDFGVLQLITSNVFSVNNLWKVFGRHKQLWVKRSEKDDYWCAGAYIINKEVLKPYIDGILEKIENSLFKVHIIAGYERPCEPTYCCKNHQIIKESHCVNSAKGYQSDSFVYSLAHDRTYMLTVPMVTGAKYGNASTLHQDHVVHFHVNAFHRINELAAELANDDTRRPTFLNKECSYKL
jgi:GR25 family glycosyltransferase involved in LPS biosynthesis